MLLVWPLLMKPLLQLWHFSFFFKFIFFYRKQLHQALNCRAIEIKTHSFTGNLLFPVCPVFAASIHSSSVSQTLAFWLSPTIKPGSTMPVFTCLATIHQGDASNKNRDPRCMKEERKHIPSPMYTPSTLAKGLERDVAATGYCGLPTEGAAQEDLSGFWSLKCFVLTGIDHAALALLACPDIQSWEGEFSLNHQEFRQKVWGQREGRKSPAEVMPLAGATGCPEQGGQPPAP